MTNESAILRAYALLSQGKHDEAEQMLKDAPGALNTPSGADLFARLRFEQGFDDEARQIWERVQAAFPDFEPANKALAAFVSPPERQGGDDCAGVERRAFPFVALSFLLLGGVLAAWGLLHRPEMVVQVRERVLTNTVERVVRVPIASSVTSVVERVSIVTNTVPAVCREVVTNTVERVVTLERVVTNETVKVVFQESPGVEPESAAKEPLPTPAATTVAFAGDEQKAADEESEILSLGFASRESCSPFASHETWLDRVIFGFYKKLGLMPEARPSLMIEGKK